MAAQPQQNQQQDGFFANAAAAVKAVQQAVNEPIDKLTGPVMRDGMLAAAFRQGAGEIGEALKAFPQSIQVQEPGTLLNPTQGEIASARDPEKMPSLSEIAAGQPLPGAQPDNGKQQQEQQHQKEMGMSM
jgi:hypothetical protein